MPTAVVLFTRDLRLHDNPALHAASTTATAVVPLFVVDPKVTSSANRQRFLAESLADLREGLRRRGGDLVVRYGDPVTEAVTLAKGVGADSIMLAADVSAYATNRQRRLTAVGATEQLAVRLFPGVTVVPPGQLRPTSGSDHYRVFTPYWRVWQAYRRRPELPAPAWLPLPGSIDAGQLPIVRPDTSPSVLPGGESAARRRLTDWSRHTPAYAERHNDLPANGTSRLSPYLHFGCVSPITVVAAVNNSDEFIRQLCWRDFYHQVLGGFPTLPSQPYRPGSVEEWHTDPTALAAWQSGHTGIPIVDAGMRQLAAEGFMHNRARLITASFLTKRLRLDWRVGAQWYAQWLLDADVANNYGNWQWVAGTGNDTRPYRQFNPVRQAQRFDPQGVYVRRWVPELADIPGAAVHEPWLLPAADRRHISYEPPITVAPERTS